MSRRSVPKANPVVRGTQGSPMSQQFTLAQIAAACSAEGAGLALPSDDSGGFAEPWQAHAFAMTVLLHQRGLFTWTEWARCLAQQIQRAQAGGDPDDGNTYYRHWLDALEQLTIDKQVATAEQIHALEHAWEAAAARTPHGQPIELLAADSDRAG